MNIFLSKEMGHCFGVKNALKLALQKQNKSNLTIIGQLVHNPQTVKKLENFGIYCINTLDDIKKVKTKKVMITAHGTSLKNKKILLDKDFIIEDASCPLVLKVHKTIKKMVKDGFFPVVIGQPDHVEVKGIVGDLKKFLVIFDGKDLSKLKKIKAKKIGIVSQTTNQVEKVKKIVNDIKKSGLFEEVLFKNTICKPTQDRQNAARILSKKTDLMIVIGGYNSSNTKKLVEICKEKLKKVYHIEKEEELKSNWFKGIKNVGITAGASTPDDTINNVFKKIKNMQTFKNKSVINKKLKKCDLIGLKDLKISLDQVEKQIKVLANEKQVFLNLQSSCLINNGIIKLTEKELKAYAVKYKKTKINSYKFIPASGAATRLFNDVIIQEHKVRFIKNIKKFAFFNKLKEAFKLQGYNLDKLLKTKEYDFIINTLLDKKGLNYLNLPKALIPFHQYNNASRTAFEEHLIEAKYYLKNVERKRNLHFTINDKHKKLFLNHLTAIKDKNSYNITFSTQKKSTNVIAFTKDNKILRDEKGEIVLRPAGHGALIDNLNKLAKHADLIFIKNIDNVFPENKVQLTNQYKQAFAGLLISLQQEIKALLNKSEKRVDEKIIKRIESFCIKKFDYKKIDKEKKLSLNQRLKVLKKFLNRPIRICGVVPNKGETGGLPFWVEENGNITKQIIESAQIDFNNSKIKKMIKKSTHFNPVFMACSTKNYQGKKFNLKKFINHNAIITTKKPYKGDVIKILELPGLWNGGMYYWNTIFVAIPGETFAPVKNIMDLLKSSHQV